MRRDEERERSLISFDGEDNNNNTKKKKDTFFFAIRKYAQKGLLHATDGTRSFTSFFLSLSLYKYALWSAVRVWVMQKAFSVSRVMFPPMGKLREGGRFGARERVSGFAKEKLMLVPRLIGADFVRIEV